MKPTLRRILKNLTVIGCALLCLWCAAVKCGSWMSEESAHALLFAAGLEAKPVSSAPELFELPLAGAAAEETEGTDLSEAAGGLLPDDGIVPFHNDELPGAAPTPDPARASGPVEEILLEGGAPVMEDLFVRDTTGSGTDLAAELREAPSVRLKADGRPEVLIYHTHTSEAYAKSAAGFYYTDMETRTGNRERNVTAVGEAMKKALEAQGIGVIHDVTVNDEIYNGSYGRSWEVLQKNLEQYPDLQVTIDVHRDSMTTQEGVKYKPTAVIGGRKAAQVMLLAGCDADGDWGDFPDWRENLRLILRVQQALTRAYPELVRPLDFSNSKYNMNATKGSMLVEVGTEVNTAAEAKYAGRLVGEVLGELLLELSEP